MRPYGKPTGPVTTATRASHGRKVVGYNLDLHQVSGRAALAAIRRAPCKTERAKARAEAMEAEQEPACDDDVPQPPPLGLFAVARFR